MFRRTLRALWEFITMTRRPLVQTPKIGQIIRNTTTGLTLLVVGIVGQTQHPVLPLFLVGNALGGLSKRQPLLAPLLSTVASLLHQVKYLPGTVILADGTGMLPAPWPPAGWEVVTHLGGSAPLPWTPETDEAKALAEEIKAQAIAAQAIAAQTAPPVEAEA